MKFSKSWLYLANFGGWAIPSGSASSSFSFLPLATSYSEDQSLMLYSSGESLALIKMSLRFPT